MSDLSCCPSCRKALDAPTESPLARCPFCGTDLAEPAPDAAMYFTARLACLQDVEWLETGGLRDAVAGVIGRYRETFRTAEVRVPRPRVGALDLPCACPACGQTIVLRVKSRLRTALPYLSGAAALGLALAVLGWLNVPSVGDIAWAAAGFGLLLICGPALVFFVAPRLLDNPTAAFRILQDAPRAEALYIHKGPHPETTNHAQLTALGRNQHKLESVRPATD